MGYSLKHIEASRLGYKVVPNQSLSIYPGDKVHTPTP